jgi:hypothetical protein
MTQFECTTLAIAFVAVRDSWLPTFIFSDAECTQIAQIANRLSELPKDRFNPNCAGTA